MPLTLYKLDGSPPARAAMMTIVALNISNVKFIDVNLFTGDHFSEEYLKLNPQHTVPTLKDDDFVIWDSHAIGAYLIGKYGNDDSLYPTDLKKRAIVDQRLHFDSGILFPALRSTVAPVFFKGEKEFNPENLQKIKEAYDLTEKFLTSTWIAGDKLTLADICCVASISSMDKLLPIDENMYPNITAWLQRCSELDFYKKANLPGVTAFGDLAKAKTS